MSLMTTPSTIARQIALAEVAIAGSNQRLRTLRHALLASAKHSLYANRVPLMVGGAALVALGVVLYPRKRAILARARWMMRSAAVRTMVTTALPLMARFMSHEPAASKTPENAPSP